MMNFVTLDSICNNDSVSLYCSSVIWFHDFRSDMVTKTTQDHALPRHLKSIGSRVKKKLNYPGNSPSGGENKLHK
jgi:hypothetical protein